MYGSSNNIFSKKYCKSKDFRTLWEKISNEIKSTNISLEDNLLIYEEDTFMTEIPYEQEYLTEKNMVCQLDLDWSGYSQPPINHINPRNQYDCFHGVLAFLNYNSDGKLNKNEIEFHFSGANIRKDYQSIKQSVNANTNDEWNILNINNYENINTQFVVYCTKNAFFGFTFKRIQINPVAYAIKSGKYTNSDNHLVSFVFLGFDESTKTWDVLDERANINNLIPSGGFCLFYVHKTNKYYSSFQIKQTDPGSRGFYGFKIAALDVHGTVCYRNDINNYDSSSLSATFEEEVSPFNFDPLEDLSLYI